jgi:hypothetical protein
VSATKQLHFTITGEFMTEHCRSLWWDEGKCALAVDTLQCCNGITEAQVLEVIFGRAKLVGDSDAGIDIQKDNAKKSPCGNKIGSLVEYFKEREKKDRKTEDDFYDATHDPVHMASPRGLIEVGQRKAKRMKAKAPVWDESELDSCPRVFHEGAFKDAPNPFRDQRDKVEEPPEPKPPEPDPSLGSNNGWIDRDGNFYPCQYSGHVELAGEFGKTEGELEKLGWIKISCGFERESLIYCARDMDSKIPAPNELQKNTVTAWCKKFKADIPYWMQDEKL